MNINLFDKIENNFFNLLSSNSNNRLYSECLIRIYKLFEHEVSYRISREIVRDTISAYIMSEVDEDAWKNEAFSSVNDYSGAIIRKFYDSGWLIEEVDDVTYEKQVVMSESSIALAEFIIQLIKPSKTEYSSFVYNIYNRLNNRTQWESNPYTLALKPIYLDAKHLANSLKKLSTSIKKIIEELVEKETLEELTKNLLSYFEGSFIKEYSRLAKEQNIHFYRNSIINKLSEIQNDSDEYELMVIDCYDNENYNEENDAEQQVHHMLKSTIQFLTVDYDKLMNNIQKKINIYLNLAVGRARFILNHDKDSRGYVQQVLKLLIDNSENYETEEYISQNIDELFNLYTQEFVDTTSLSFPKKQRAVKEVVYAEIPEMTQDDIDRTAEVIRKEAYNPFERELVKEYTLNVLGNKNSIHAEDFTVQSKNDVLTIMSAVAYSVENGFEIEPNETFIEINGFCIRDFTITRKSEDKK